jgi:hypothetical protein
MEQVPRPLPGREKLTVAAEIDYPAAEQIIVSFPNRWELVKSFNRGDTPLYVAGLPFSQVRPRRGLFFGLSPEVNQSLTSYRMYTLFEPWPMPTVPVSWDEIKGEGRVLDGGRLAIHLQPLCQAQAWTGSQVGVIWECYLHQTRRPDTWQQELAQFWRAVETDMQVSKVFTQPHEPTFQEGYIDFLSDLGYSADPNFPRWWSKRQLEYSVNGGL